MMIIQSLIAQVLDEFDSIQLQSKTKPGGAGLGVVGLTTRSELPCLKAESRTVPTRPETLGGERDQSESTEKYVAFCNRSCTKQTSCHEAPIIIHMMCRAKIFAGICLPMYGIWPLGLTSCSGCCAGRAYTAWLKKSTNTDEGNQVGRLDIAPIP